MSAADILKARALTLAREPVKKSEAASLHVIPFELAGESYALEASALQEVHSLRDLTPLPQTPSFVLGILNVRGHILAVIDLNRFFDLPPTKDCPEPTHILRIHANEMPLGLAVNTVGEMSAINLAMIHAPLAGAAGPRADALKGVTNSGVAILDMEKILSSEKMSAISAEA